MIENEQAIALLKRNKYLTLATADKKGTPWISNIFYAVDKSLNFFWYSRTVTKHSENILARPQVALNIYTAIDPNNVDALYIEAEAKEIEGMENIIHAMKVLTEKMQTESFMSQEELDEFMKRPSDFFISSPFRLYMAKPKKIYKYVSLENWKDKYVDGRIELKLPDLKRLLAI